MHNILIADKPKILEALIEKLAFFMFKSRSIGPFI